MLSGKSLTTFVTLARPAKTVAAPVLERTEDAEKGFAGRRNCSAFSQGYVVRGVERVCGKMTERPYWTSVEC